MLAARAQSLRHVRNRSTETLLMDGAEREQRSPITETLNPEQVPEHQSAVAAAPHLRAPGRLVVIARLVSSAMCGAVRFELRFQLLELGLLFGGEHGLHVLSELKSFAH